MLFSVVVPLGLVLLYLKLFCFSYFPIFESFCPELLVILATYLAVYARAEQALLCNCYLGLLRDFSSCEIMGVFAALFTLLTFLFLKFKKGVMVENIVVLVLLTFLFSVQCCLMHAVLLFFLHGSDVFGNCLPIALFTALTSPFLLPFLGLFFSAEKIS